MSYFEVINLFILTFSFYRVLHLFCWFLWLFKIVTWKYKVAEQNTISGKVLFSTVKSTSILSSTHRNIPARKCIHSHQYQWPGFYREMTEVPCGTTAVLHIICQNTLDSYLNMQVPNFLRGFHRYNFDCLWILHSMECFLLTLGSVPVEPSEAHYSPGLVNQG